MSKRAASTRIAACPKNDVLGQLASGSLAEARAEPLFQHIAACARCRKIIDKLEQRADKHLQNHADKASTDGQLDQLIARAQKLKDSDPDFTLHDPTRRGRHRSEPAKRVSVDGFVDGLKRSGLVREADVLNFLGQINTDDSSVLAKQLVSRGKLTTFQAKSLLRGRWKGLVLGNYIIQEKLGQGGMGSVFKARHRRMGRTVCLKVMNSTGRKSPEMMHRFRQEARTAGALSHPNIVVAHDADEANGIPFLVMEYIEGTDLAKHVSENGPLPVDQTVHLISQAAQALSYAHREGVVHRDIKPHNLLLSEQTDSGLGVPSVKVLDMGLARFDSFMTDNPDASVHAAMTTTGVIMGTVDYMAPEQAICTRDADNRSDIYSLGCTMHFLLTGKPVYDGETIMARLVAHRETPIPSLHTIRRDVSPDLDAVFRKMVAKRAEHRYQSMEELLRDLDAITTGQQPHAALVAGTSPGASETLNAISTTTLPTSPTLPAAQTSVVEQPRGHEKKSRRTILIWITTLALTALVTIGLLTVTGNWFGQSENQVAQAQPVKQEPKIAGHADALRNGGKGRALFLLPTHKGADFDDAQFVAAREALEQQGIEWVSMGIDDLPANPRNGRIKAFRPDLTVDEFRADDFDAIFIVEGNLKELVHKQPEDHAKIRNLLATALDAGQVVSVIRDACNVAKDAGVLDGMQFEELGGLTIGTQEDGGVFVKIENDCDIKGATEKIFTDILKLRNDILHEAAELK